MTLTAQDRETPAGELVAVPGPHGLPAGLLQARLGRVRMPTLPALASPARDLLAAVLGALEAVTESGRLDEELARAAQAGLRAARRLADSIEEEVHHDDRR